VMDRLHRVLKTVEPDLKGASELGTLASLRRELQWRERATQKPE
jgi:hypothetical protein